MSDERVEQAVLYVALNISVYKNTMRYVIAAFILACFVTWDFAEKKGSFSLAALDTITHYAKQPSRILQRLAAR